MHVQHHNLDTLLVLDGERVVLEALFWVKFDVRRVPRSVRIPHGVRYSLTLHRPDGVRILGFDNAHAVPHQRSRSAYTGRVTSFDHEHIYNGKPDPQPVHYEFNSPGELLRDFWSAVDAALSSEITP